MYRGIGRSRSVGIRATVGVDGFGLFSVHNSLSRKSNKTPRAAQAAQAPKPLIKP